MAQIQDTSRTTFSYIILDAPYDNLVGLCLGYYCHMKLKWAFSVVESVI